MRPGMTIQKQIQKNKKVAGAPARGKSDYLKSVSLMVAVILRNWGWRIFLWSVNAIYFNFQLISTSLPLQCLVNLTGKYVPHMNSRLR